MTIGHSANSWLIYWSLFSASQVTAPRKKRQTGQESPQNQSDSDEGQDGTEQDDESQGTPNQGDTNQGSTNQDQGDENQDQGGENQDEANQGGTNQGGTNQGGTDQGSTNQGGTNQGQPEPANAANKAITHDSLIPPYKSYGVILQNGETSAAFRCECDKPKVSLNKVFKKTMTWQDEYADPESTEFIAKKKEIELEVNLT